MMMKETIWTWATITCSHIPENLQLRCRDHRRDVDYDEWLADPSVFDTLPMMVHVKMMILRIFL
jgi:hypothetical protein